MAFSNVQSLRNLVTTADTFRAPSPAVWGAQLNGVSNGFPWDQVASAEKTGIAFYDDFDNIPLAPTLTTQIGWGQYKAFATSGETIAGTSVVNSVDLGYPTLKFTTGSSANSASLAIAYPGSLMTGVPTTGVAGIYFEARLAISSITASHLGFLVGLAETNLWTLATGVPFSSNTGAAITNGAAFIGFNKTAANTTTASTVVSDRATSFTAVGSGEVTGLATNTFTKLGLVYDPNNVTRCVRFFQDGIELTTAYTRAQVVATTNLKAGSLAPIIALVGGSAASSDYLHLSSWRLGVLGN